MNPDAGVGPATDDAASTLAEPRRPSLLRNLAHLMSSQLITWVLATAVAVAMPRFLGPAGLGQIGLAIAVWTITQLFVGLGTSTYLKLEVARDRTRGLAIVGSIIVLRLVAFAAASAILLLIGIVVGVDGETTVVFALVGASVLINLMADIGASALGGLEQMSYLAVATIVSKFLYTGAVIAVLLAGGGVRAVAATSLVGAVATFVILWSSFRKFGRVSFARPLAEAGAIVRASSPFFVLGAMLVVYQQIDTVVISALVEREVLGWYNTADTLFGTLLFVPTIFMAAILPRFRRLYVYDPPALAQLMRQSFSSLFLIGVPIGLGTLVVADRFAVLLFGDKFKETGPVLAVFGVVIILTFGTILLGGLAAATDRQRFWNLVMLAAIVMSVALDVVLVPWADERHGNGAIGGALAFVVTEAFMLVIGVWKLAPDLVDRASLARYVKIALAGGAMLAATWPTRDSFLAITVVVGAVVYVAAIVGLRTLTADERVLLGRGVARFRRRS